MPIPVCWRGASIRADASVTQNDESSAAIQVAAFLRRQQGKTAGKTGRAERDELSDGRLCESDFPVRNGSGAGATTRRGTQTRCLLVRNGNAKPAPHVF